MPLVYHKKKLLQPIIAYVIGWLTKGKSMSHKTDISAWLMGRNITHRFMNSTNGRQVVQFWWGDKFRNMPVPGTAFSWALIEQRLEELLEEMGGPVATKHDPGEKKVSYAADVFKNQKVSTGPASKGTVIKMTAPSEFPEFPQPGSVTSDERNQHMLKLKEAGLTDKQIHAAAAAVGWGFAPQSVSPMLTKARAEKGKTRAYTPRKPRAPKQTVVVRTQTKAAGSEDLALEIAAAIAPVLEDQLGTIMGDLKKKADKLDALLSLIADD